MRVTPDAATGQRTGAALAEMPDEVLAVFVREFCRRRGFAWPLRLIEGGVSHPESTATCATNQPSDQRATTP